MSKLRDEQNDTKLRLEVDRRGGGRAATTVRRGSPRIYGPCVAMVQSEDTAGHPFKERTVLCDVSAGGLYVRLWRDVPVQAQIRIVFAFSTVALSGVGAPVVAVQGVVARVEPQTSDGYGVAVEFRSHCFL